MVNIRNSYIILVLIGGIYGQSLWGQGLSLEKQPVEKKEVRQPSFYHTDKNMSVILQAKVPKQYMIANVNIVGAQYFDKNLILSLAHLPIGTRITLPGGDQISKAIQALWKQQIFEDVQIYISRVADRNIDLEIRVVEKPRLSKIIYQGLRKGEREELEPKFSSYTSKIITHQMRRNIYDGVKDYLGEKAFLNPRIRMQAIEDETYPNSLILVVSVERGSKNKVEEIAFFGNTFLSGTALRGKMSEISVLPRLRLFAQAQPFFYGAVPQQRWGNFIKDFTFLSPYRTLVFLDPYFRWNIFSGAKFNKSKYEGDKEKIIEAYNTIGFRDAYIEKDTVYRNNKGRLNIEMKLNEGRRYYFGVITFQGNTKYSDSILHLLLDIKKGDIYNIELLYKRIGKIPTMEGQDISTLYLDNGYLFFRADPIEKRIYGDTIDYEIKILEGPQATIRQVNIFGNDKTKDYVIRREIRTVPGDKFSRSALIRSQRELANLKFFNPEHINITPIPHIEDGTVDINYTVEEKSADQLEFAVGYSGFVGLTGTVGITLNNFSVRDIFKKNSWKPLPSGDGQQLSLRLQSNGPAFISSNIAFVEPWLGHKKRLSLSVQGGYSYYGLGSNFNQFTPGLGSALGGFSGLGPITSSLSMVNAGVSLGKQVKWPDDYFTVGVGLNFVQYFLKEYPLFPEFSNGTSTNVNVNFTISRVSIDQALFPRQGSNIKLTLQYTPPYSVFRADKSSIAAFRWIEYHKYKLYMDWYLPLTKPLGVDKNRQLILKLSLKYGYITGYNPAVELSPFERFQLGDEGLFTQNSFLGFDVVAQRGYYVYNNSNPKVNPEQRTTNDFFTLFNKYVAELRYPISTNPNATIFATAYFEAANGWYSFRDYNPLNLRRSVGVGLRFFLPAFGLLGFDYALGLDRLQSGFNNATRFHFILGFEPD